MIFNKRTENFITALPNVYSALAHQQLVMHTSFKYFGPCVSVFQIGLPISAELKYNRFVLIYRMSKLT